VIGYIARGPFADQKLGFSRRNLFYTRRLAALWPESASVPSAMAQVGWTAHRYLLDAFSVDRDLYEWCACSAIVGSAAREDAANVDDALDGVPP